MKVIDPFAGSGTALVEARLLGLKGIGVEISPLSALICRVKSKFPESGDGIRQLVLRLGEAYSTGWAAFVGRQGQSFTHDDVLGRAENPIGRFENVTRWFTTDALLGVSLVVEFAHTLDGYERDVLMAALSSQMRSIGNVDVDVVRAEYSRHPRDGVDALRLVSRRLLKYAADIDITVASHSDLIGPSGDIEVILGSVLTASIEAGSVDAIVTSPPYGVESLSYLRTHLLSFRALESLLGVDPYYHDPQVIGSEYLQSGSVDPSGFLGAAKSQTYLRFFGRRDLLNGSKNEQRRVVMMMKFFDDMAAVARNFGRWLTPAGSCAFVIGNKRLGETIIPADRIVEELFLAEGLAMKGAIRHKLKTNNSNSEVPWQERTIQEEAVLLFHPA